MNFSNKIKYYRKKEKLTQEEFAKILHTSRKTISGWENNRNYPDIKTLILISNELKIPIDNLIRDDDLVINTDKKIERYDKLKEKISILFYINIFIISIGYIEMLNIFGFHLPLLISILIIISIVISLIYLNLQKTRFFHNKYLIWFSLISLIVNINLSYFKLNFIKIISLNNTTYLIGLLIGKTVITLLLTTLLFLEAKIFSTNYLNLIPIRSFHQRFPSCNPKKNSQL